MDQQHGRYARLRYIATGAIGALAAVGAIAGSGALAAKPHARTHHVRRHAALADCGATKTPTGQGPGKTGTPPPPDNPQPFLDAVQQLVDNGTITAAQGQIVDQQIRDGGIDTDSLASQGFTQSQLDAIQQALTNTKQSMAGAGQAAGAAKQQAAKSAGS